MSHANHCHLLWNHRAHVAQRLKSTQAHPSLFGVNPGLFFLSFEPRPMVVGI